MTRPLLLAAAALLFAIAALAVWQSPGPAPYVVAFQTHGGNE